MIPDCCGTMQVRAAQGLIHRNELSKIWQWCEAESATQIDFCPWCGTTLPGIATRPPEHPAFDAVAGAFAAEAEYQKRKTRKGRK